MSLLKSERGFGVPVMLIAIAVVLAAAAAGAGYALKVRADLKKQVVFSAREVFVQRIKGHITNELGWNRTLADPSNAGAFACLNTPGANCCASVGVEFGLYDQTGNVVYDGRANPAVGFNYAAQSCATFNETTGDPACAFRATVAWSGVNTGTDPLCRSAEIRIEMKHKDPNTVVPFNSKAAVAGNVFVRTKEEGFLVSHCTAIGGAFDQKTNECTMRAAGGVCPPGQFLTGLGPTGTIICAAAAGITSGIGACSEGTALRTLAVAGTTATPGCVPFPSLGPCLTDYHMEGNYCYYDYRGSCTGVNGTGRFKWNGSNYSTCAVETCSAGFFRSPADGSCQPTTLPCMVGTVGLPLYATAGTTTWNGTTWGACQPTSCLPAFRVSGATCALNPIGGSYSLSCRNCSLTGSVYSCECDDGAANWPRSQLDMTTCPSSAAENIFGNLRCS